MTGEVLLTPSDSDGDRTRRCRASETFPRSARGGGTYKSIPTLLGCDKESHPSFETLPPTAANKEGVWLARVPMVQFRHHHSHSRPWKGDE